MGVAVGIVGPPGKTDEGTTKLTSWPLFDGEKV